MKKRVTIDDVAQQAGVSRQTVSRAINDLNGISVATRGRVLAAVDDLGYRPSRLAQGMASNHTLTIGLVVGSITNPTNAEIMRGLQDAALAKKYNVFLRNTDYVVQHEREAIHSLIAENVDGIVLVGTTLEEEELRSFADKDFPIVVMYGRISAPYISSIDTDVARATQTMMEYLFGGGHRAIGLITRTGELSQIRQFCGYQNAYQTHKFSYSPKWIAQEETTLNGGYQAARYLLTRCSELTALCTYNDLMALGAIKACYELGRPVPESIAVFGYNDSPFAPYIRPALSTIRVPCYQLGEMAMVRLLEMAAEPEIVFPTIVSDIELIIRDSTRSL